MLGENVFHCLSVSICNISPPQVKRKLVFTSSFIWHLMEGLFIPSSHKHFLSTHGSMTLNKALWAVKRQPWALVLGMLSWQSCSKGLAKELTLCAGGQPPSTFSPETHMHIIIPGVMSSYQSALFVQNSCHWGALGGDDITMVTSLRANDFTNFSVSTIISPTSPVTQVTPTGTLQTGHHSRELL